MRPNPSSRSLRTFVVLSALLACATVARGGGNCSDTTVCDGSAIQLNLTCSNSSITVTPEVCSGGNPTFKPSLIQVSVRCFTGDEQARYTDRHNFGFETDGTFDAGQILDHYEYGDLISNGLLDNCGEDYIVAARWLFGTEEFQAQCSPGGSLVPTCVAPSLAAQEEIQQRVRLYSMISPAGAQADSCFDGEITDHSFMELRNLAPSHAFHSVLAGRYICVVGEAPGDPTPLTACDDDGVSGPGDIRAKVDCSSGACVGNVSGLGVCEGGTCGLVSGVNLAAGGSLAVEINGDETFDNCCDRETSSEPLAGDCSNTDFSCSPWDIQCTTATIFGDCDSGDCTLPGATFTPYHPVVWLGPVSDIDIGHHLEKTRSDAHVQDACLGFSFRGSFPDAPGIVPHLFGPAVTPVPVEDNCSVNYNIRADIDFDGIYDKCDPVVGSRGLPDGTGRLILRNKVRNEGPYGEAVDFNALTNLVTINSIAVTIDPGESNADRLTVEVPVLPVSSNHLIKWKPTAAEGQAIIAPQNFTPVWYGYVSDGTPDGVLVMDQVSENVVDGNRSPTNSYVNLNCDDGDDVTAVSAPIDMVARGSESPTDVYVLSDVVAGNPPVAGSRLFGFGVSDHRVLGITSGVEIPGQARALDLAHDEFDSWDAYVAWEHFPGYGKISRVDVDDPLDLVNWGSKEDGLISIQGTPARVAAHYISENSTVKVYVTSVVCQGGGSGMAPLGPICVDCGGGPNPPSRELHVTILDGADLSVNYGSYKISDTTPGCSERPTLQNFGLAFSEDRNLMFVANPDLDRVEVIQTDDQVKLSPIGLPAGCDPHDVAVVVSEDAEGEPREQAYVVCRGDQRVRVIDVATLMLNSATVINLVPTGSDPELIPVAVAARSDGLRLFTADSTARTISVVNLDAGSIFWNQKVGDIHTGSNPDRLVLLGLPTP